MLIIICTHLQQCILHVSTLPPTSAIHLLHKLRLLQGHESMRCDCLTREVHGCCTDQRFTCGSYKTCSGQYTKVALNQGKAVCAGKDGKTGFGEWLLPLHQLTWSRKTSHHAVNSTQSGTGSTKCRGCMSCWIGSEGQVLQAFGVLLWWPVPTHQLTWVR